MEKQNFKAITLEAFKGKLEVKDHTLRELKSDEVLVKIMCCSIMPADLALLQGTYGSSLPNLPCIPGMEGSGSIEAVGKDIDVSLIGKRVSIVASSSSPSYMGCWSQYSIAKLQSLLVFDSEISYEKIFNAQANPLTALGFIDTIKKAGKTSVAHNGASSAFGRMFMRLCIENGIEVVNIVRKDQTVKELTELGGKHFVNTSVKGWEEELKVLCEKLDISIIFDCCGGTQTARCLEAIKPGGTLYHFGNLELKRISDLNTHEFIFKCKKIEGWWLVKWLVSLSKEEMIKYKEYIKNDFEKNDGKLFSTSYNKEFSFGELEKAFETYLTEGSKILFKPWN